jgi:DNA-binding winged helix-turn-helix (wHTH) protein/tetratricopeptide (TPR) repeat protein
MTLGTSLRSVVALTWRLCGENVKMAGSSPHTADALGGVYQFADVTVDLDRFELQRAGALQHVEPQVFEVLAYLIRHRDRLVTKQELMDQVWHDRFISDSAITSRIKAARRATGDDGERQNVIRTVHGRGYRFVAEVAQPVSRPDPAETARAGFVGRNAELGALWGSLAAAESGSRQLLLISGEPGIGKTAIVEAFLAGLDGSIELVGVGQCHPVGAGEPYAPVLDAIFDLAKGPAAAEVLRRLDTVAPGWLLQLPALIDVDHESSLVNRTLGATPERMLREALDLFDALAAVGYGPLVLVVDDLHWADRPTLDLITAVGRRRRPASLLVIGTYRHTDLDDGHPLSATVSELVVRGLARHVRLEPLSLETTTELVAGRRADPPPPDAIKALHRRSGGNPLFLGALLDTAEHGPDTDLPRSLRELVEHHLERLQPADREVIETAAVAGIDFPVRLLGSSREVDEVWQRCHALARRDQLIAFDDRGRQGYFHFRHSLYREVTYAGVPHPRRRALHQLVGERLEATTDDVTSSAAELAEHFTQSGDGRRAVRHRLVAAEVAALRNAPAAALEHLRSGLEMLPLVPDGEERQRVEADLLASSVAMALSVDGFDSPQAEPELQRARELYVAVNDTGSANRMTYWLAGLHEYRGEFDRSEALMRQRLQTAGEDRQLVELHDLLACSLFHLGEFGDSIQHAREALSRYDSDRDRTTLAFVGENAFVTSQHWAAFSFWFTGYPDTALRHSQAAVRMARRPDYAFSLCLGLEMAAMLHQLRREPERVVELAAEMETLAVQGGLPYRQATAGVLLGWARSALGEPAAGCRDLAAALTGYRRTGAASELPYFLILYADAARLAGMIEVGQRALDEARTLASFRPSFVSPEVDRLDAALLLQAGADSAVAERHLRAALATARNRGALALELRAAADLRRLELANGRPGDAARILRSAVEKFTEGHDLPDLRDASGLLR